MTYIKPHQNKNSNFKLFFFLIPILSAVFSLVVVYNMTVDTRHTLEKTRKSIQEIEASNANLRDRIFSMTGNNLQQFAEERGFVQEQKPTYLQVEEKWAVASY